MIQESLPMDLNAQNLKEPASFRSFKQLIKSRVLEVWVK